MERRLHRERFHLRQQHQHHRRRHAPHRVSVGADPHDQQLRSRATACSKRPTRICQGDDVREGLTAVISVKVPEPQFEGQTKTKLGNSEVKGIVEALVNESLGQLPRGASRATRKRSLSKGRRSGARPRGRAQGQGSRPAQGRARFGMSLPGKLADCQERDPALQRALPRRGRFGRRLGQAGPRPAQPGDPAAERQDPQRREGALRQDALVAGDPADDHRARHRASARTIRRRPSCATTRSSS